MPVQVPPLPNPITTVYSKFRGLHLTDHYLCDREHSPFALNLISNNEGLPELRPGWRVLHKLTGALHCLAFGVINGNPVRLAHVGSKLYTWTDSSYTLAYSGLSDTRSRIFFSAQGDQTRAFILTGTQYLCYDGKAVKPVEESATVPVILIAKKPAGGGVAFDAVNLLQAKRTEKFQGDGTSTVYQLAANSLDDVPLTVVQRAGASDTTRTDFTVNRATGQLTFATAPPTPSVAGEDNLFITYAKTVSGYADRIRKSRYAAEYGESGSGRVFLAGNPDYRNQDRWSELGDPFYFPDLNYSVVGSANTAILGYCKIARNLAIIKEDSAQDSTIFLRYPAAKGDGSLYFRLEAGIAGTGAVAPDSFVSLVDEPLFLSRGGVFAVTSNNITAERTLQNRSYFVDEQLRDEPNIKEAVATAWNGYYLLAVGDYVYAFNSRAPEPHGMSFVYNCFLWDNIRASCFLPLDGALYFGDKTGRLCRLNTDMDKDKTIGYSDDGKAIEVYWATCLDNDGLPQRLKTMQKKGSGITTKPFLRSQYEIAVVTDKGPGKRPLRHFYRDIFDLNDIDFNRFTLESSPLARFTPFRRKVKKYQALQIVVRAKALGEGFGIYNIVKEWLSTNYVKR